MRRLLALAMLALSTLPAHAEVPLTGYFTATKACPAFQSISRETNPGNIQIRPGTAYDLVAGNTANPTHLWIVVPGASPERRWVAVDCGTRATDAEGQIAEPPPPAPAPTYRGTQYILAINWQPAFCETVSGKPECERQTERSFEAMHFALHGLWPQPRSNQFCGVLEDDRWASENGRWRSLPEVRLSPELRAELNEVMPGTLSALDRHEWTKHGTCYGTSAEEYYRDATDLMLALNTSEVVDLFASNIGRKITLRQVRDAFDQAFGPGAGERVRMECEPDGNRTIITELTIGLTGTIDGPDDLATLIAAAGPTEGGCASGMVDPVGLR
ncbi:ribonuclease T2 family protein [Devosia sp. SL43]|uniref:ribonuclease T2 family protein n=1 Tax=Devosia sp. SL43 TaxID=2806348 RepID=UPI001F21B6B5|nr:ribonuclease [Devosia sp. SL43]UJW86961.1 ribonuclease [Devosia sp. SL43]